MGRPRTSNRHLPKYVTVRHGSYWYGPPKVKAVRVAREGDLVNLYKFLADKFTPSKDGKTIGDALDRYTREILPTLGERTQKDYARHIARLRAVFGHMGLEELQKRDVGQFLHPDGLTKGLVHRARTIAVLSSMYTLAVGTWFLTDDKFVNPCLGVGRVKAGRRSRYVTDEEFAIVRANMPPRHQIAMDLALLTGQRQGDLLNLKFADITATHIHFAPAKTAKKVGKRIKVKISPDLQAVIDAAKALVPQVPAHYVLRTRMGKKFSSEGFRAPWQRRMRRMATGYWRGHKGQPRVWIEPVLKSRFMFHDLRAKCVSDSKSLEEAFERAGHTSMQMTRGTYDRGEREVLPLK